MGRMADVEAMLATMGVECDVKKGANSKVSKKKGAPGYRVNKKGKIVCYAAHSSLAPTCEKRMRNFHSLCACV